MKKTFMVYRVVDMELIVAGNAGSDFNNREEYGCVLAEMSSHGDLPAAEEAVAKQLQEDIEYRKTYKYAILPVYWHG